ncbi:hypothetical protein AAJ76_4700025661 [Vairimorpha ceranae]|uniref:Uncharacterized protein n=1 Tax=Vairimorpha ceranae TaxID=40302 RepID=A0A0F9WP39_9MICR|nr:hypothetical protein AAJ76_4700025661 [Vairimorpha ceranae]KKO74758.1 hypothetical protein AAJ76_4700025661 [Vairimorpha ceranae]
MKKIIQELKKNLSECDILLRMLEKESKCITINIKLANALYDAKVDK